MFGQTTSQGSRDGEVGVKENLSSIFARIFFLKSIPYNLWVSRVYIVWVKNLVKEINFLPNREFRGFFAGWPFSRNTRETLTNLTTWYDSSASSHMLHTWLFTCYFLQVTRELVTNSTNSSFEAWFFIDLSHSSLTNKPTYIQGKWLKKLKSNLARN